MNYLEMKFFIEINVPFYNHNSIRIFKKNKSMYCIVHTTWNYTI